ncbi:hypothetical protein [Xanthomonas translucens]|uniref:hypothetical protein n=1 Tax=Xanthomonas campestris pv. translucens TaxID=343 RepID=UPI00071E8B94|nr:hypothetical protein [Xanthomonas translucens]QEN93630.1 hypothetical protein F0H33_09790 [Xanthomonas translucens pv. undulosa]QSQ58055.1 hypothetical protein ISN37_09030 [Xanthomonas translucens pv. undulosa]
MQPDTFGVYVRRRLEHWGEEFCLARDCEYLGHASRNILQTIMEHEGQIPGKAQGYKPLEVSIDAHAIELMVTDIAREQMRMACVMRAYYCGSGRRKVERYETALLLIAHLERTLRRSDPLPGVDRYLRLVEVGTAQIRGMLSGVVKAA